MICIYDKSAVKKDFFTNGLTVLDECILANINQELNGDYSLELSYPVSSHKASFLEEFNIIKANEQLFRIYKVERSQAEVLGVRVWARHIFYDLAFYFVESVKILNADLQEALEMTIPPEAQSIYEFEAFESTIAPFAVKEIGGIDAIFRLLEIYGGELYRDNFKVNIQKTIGKENGMSVRYGKNIKGLTLTMDSTNMATKIYPVGKDGLLLPERYVFVDNDLPFDVVKKVEFNTAGDADNLRIAANDYAKECAKPKLNVAINLLELSKTDAYKGFEQLTRVDLGDFVSVLHEKLGITVTLRVIRKQIDLLNPINTKIELGDPLTSIIEQLNSDELLEEIKKLLESNKSGLVLKSNADTLSIGTIKYPALIIGFRTNAPSNLNCTITLTGRATQENTLYILFSLDGVYYDLKPIQKLAKGDNVLGFNLPMPQVPAGSHSFIIEMWVSNDNFIIEKNNLQIAIEGLHIEGGLSATLPRIECYYSFLYTVFLSKLEKYHHIEEVNIHHVPYLARSDGDVCYLSEFKAKTDYPYVGVIAEISKITTAIYEEFSRISSLHYAFDSLFVEFDSETEKLSASDYNIFNRVTIKEPILTSEGIGNIFEDGVKFEVDLPNKVLYENLLNISVAIERMVI